VIARIAYDRRYNLGFPGAQRLHPFDLRKYARAWKELRRSLGRGLAERRLAVDAAVTDEQLELVHTREYLNSLRQSAVIAQAIEVPGLRRAPLWLLERFLLTPMRWAVAGTIIAGRAALEHGGVVFNLGGGFHHAKPAGGEGFSIYNDIAVMVAALRREKRLTESGRIAYIDLDAHLGNGVAWCFHDDARLFHFDMHNGAIYPCADRRAVERVDCPLPLLPGCRGTEYLSLLGERLPPFLDSVGHSQRMELAIYTAGTDVLDGDQLGGLALSLDDVLERDLFVLRNLHERAIPTVVVTGGGYSAMCYQAIARMILGSLVDQ
jgi:histone deacetylase 11